MFSHSRFYTSLYNAKFFLYSFVLIYLVQYSFPFEQPQQRDYGHDTQRRAQRHRRREASGSAQVAAGERRDGDAQEFQWRPVSPRNSRKVPLDAHGCTAVSFSECKRKDILF